MSSRNWERMHKGTWAARREMTGLGYGRKFKRRYRFWLLAQLSCWKINRNRSEDMHVYICQFTDTEGEEEIGLKHHWHIGHGKNKRRIIFGRARSRQFMLEISIRQTKSPVGFKAHIYLGHRRWFVAARVD